MIKKRLILLLLICYGIVSAQNFFPLKVGNKYQFREDWYVWGPGGYSDHGINYYGVFVLKDSSFNGEIFYEINGTGSEGPFADNYFFKYDSSKQKVLMKIPPNDTSRLAFNFNIPTDSNYISYIRGEPKEFISEGLSTEIVLGDTHTVYSIIHINNGIPKYRYKIANNIGLSRFEYRDGDIHIGIESTHYVISAIIDSIAISPIVLQIDSLYPIKDRPIDTFPFLLSIPYTASYFALIDSFYLSVELLREDSLILAYKNDISVSNPNLTFYIEGLEVNDIIKLRVTITDTSIYNNVDHYPDTGWAVIRVLPPILNVEPENKVHIFNLFQNYPNPFNPVTTITYEVAGNQNVNITVFDLLGNEVATLVNEKKNAGVYQVKFDGSILPSGIYFYQLKAGSFVKTRKMVLAK